LDISDTLAPDSAQLDAVDLLGGPRVFTIESVSAGPADQPVQVHLAEFDRPWRPGKSMRRVLAACWGTQSSAWIGRRVKLYCDASVTFGNAAVGGTRIAALSHIDGTKKIPLLVSQGRSAVYTVEPLGDEPAATTAPTEPMPLPERIEAAIAAYARASITVPMLCARVARPREDWDDANVADLEALYRALVAGEKTKDAEFDLTGADQ
jgi:hypothetical protein